MTMVAYLIAAYLIAAAAMSWAGMLLIGLGALTWSTPTMHDVTRRLRDAAVIHRYFNRRVTPSKLPVRGLIFC